jgi:hypothetical protein
MLADLLPGPGSSTFFEIAAAGERFFFSANDGVHGYELWAVTTAPPPATDFYPLEPCRVIDTRLPSGPSGGPALSANTTRTFPVAGRCGIPATATAVAVTVTATGATDSGHFRLYPAGAATFPITSALNYVTGDTRASNGIFLLEAQARYRCGVAWLPDPAG